MSDAKAFTIITGVDDPLAAERLVEVLREAGIDAFTRPRGAASSASFEPAGPAFWELFVPSDKAPHAVELVKDELEALERDAEANALAAEEESMSGETPSGE